MKNLLMVIPFLLFVSCDKKHTVKYTETSVNTIQTPVESSTKNKTSITQSAKVSCETLFKRHGRCILGIKDKTKLYNIPLKGSPIKGTSNPLVKIVEFTDFQCPACKYMSTEILPKILKKYKDDVQLVLKHFPLNFHPFASLAAEAASTIKAIKGEQAFWKFHDTIFQNQEKLSKEYIYQVAQEVGVNMEKFKKAMNSGMYKKDVKADLDLGNEINVEGTPSLYINGIQLEQGMDLEKLLETQIKKAKILVKSGTPREKVYSFMVDHGKLIYETPIPQKEQQKELNAKKDLFMERCKSNEPKLQAFVKLMRMCTKEKINCKTFGTCIESKLKDVQ